LKELVIETDISDNVPDEKQTPVFQKTAIQLEAVGRPGECLDIQIEKAPQVKEFAPF
jgi:hypothetical protein